VEGGSGIDDKPYSLNQILSANKVTFHRNGAGNCHEWGFANSHSYDAAACSDHIRLLF
jgi:hypothetical protein